MRFVLASTPRSGNTWLRLLLGDLFELTHFPVHTPNDLDWTNMPDNCIVQLHWPRVSKFIDLLKDHGFIIITISRHPLDILLSILNFSQHEPDTALWLDGQGGDESLIIGKSPASKDFLKYSCSVRAQYLLNVTADWWNYADVAVKYEDLVWDTEFQLTNIVNLLNEPKSKACILKSIEAFKFEDLQSTSNNQHFWKGASGHWSRYIPYESALKIFHSHRHIFESLGYVIHNEKRSIEECESLWSKESFS